MVQQEGQPQRNAQVPSAVGAQDVRGEMLGEAGRHTRGTTHFRPSIGAVQEQVEGQRDPISRADRPDFVAPVGVERDQHQVVPGTAVNLLAAGVVHHQLAAGAHRREHGHQCRDHLVVLFGVLVGQEELPLAVDQHGVELGGQPRAFGQGKLFAELFQGRVEARLPRGAAQRDPVRGDFPGVANRGVVQGLFATSIPGRPGGRDQLLRLGRSDRGLHRPYAVHAQFQHIAGQAEHGAVRPVRLNVGKNLCESFAGGLRHGNGSNSMVIGTTSYGTCTTPGPGMGGRSRRVPAGGRACRDPGPGGGGAVSPCQPAAPGG